MSDQNKNEGKTKKPIRILVTGAGERIIQSVETLFPQGYEVERCQPTEKDILNAIAHSFPHVIVVCLQNETRDMLRAYDALTSKNEYESIPVMAVGYEEECDQFVSRLPLRNLKAFHRPLNRERFQETLHSFVEIALEMNLARYFEEEGEEVPDEEDMDGENLFELDKALMRKIEMFSRLHGRQNILVVDDDVRMLNVIKLYLQDLYDVAAVPSGKLALKYVSKKKADLVLLDYMMPEMDGSEVLRQIRQKSPHPDVPVIFLTGVSDKDMVMRCLEYHPNGYLLKPVVRQALVEKVTEVILGL